MGRVTSNGTEFHYYGGIPTVVDIRLSDGVVYRSGSVEFHVNSTDDKTDEKDLKCHMRYENPNGTWAELKPSYDVAGGYWKSALTIPTDYFTGDYEVGVFFSDPEGNVGPEDYALFSVLNNIPAVSATNIPVKEIFRGGAVNIEVNLTDVEDEPGSMSCRLQYRAPSGSWKSASGPPGPTRPPSASVSASQGRDRAPRTERAPGRAMRRPRRPWPWHAIVSASRASALRLRGSRPSAGWRWARWSPPAR